MVAHHGDHGIGPSPPHPRLRRRPRVVVLWNYTALSENAEISEPPAREIDDICGLLRGRGYDVFAFNAEDNCDRMGDAVVVHRPDVIINLIDHFHGDTLMTGPAAGMLDVFEYPYVGADPLCLATCQDRLRTHLLLREALVPVTNFVPVWDAGPLPMFGHLRLPLILSQAFDDIYHRAADRPLLESAAELEVHAAEILPEYDPPFIIEEYVGHRRLAAIVIAGDEVLPPCELWRHPESGWEIAVADLEAELESAVAVVALRVVAVLGCRDWARVDMVVTEDGKPLVTDVRPIVDPWHADSPFRVAAAEHPEGVGGVLGVVVESALARIRRQAQMAADETEHEHELAPTPTSTPTRAPTPAQPSTLTPDPEDHK